MMKILNIGDPHGRQSWKLKTHGSIEAFDQWVMTTTMSQITLNDEITNTYPFEAFDKIVFIGDYVDSFTISSPNILKNLYDIITFKKLCPDRVILLIGNHDVSYTEHNQQCPGYRPEIAWETRDAFVNNWNLFTMAYEETGSDGKKYIWTHAGITEPWLNSVKKEMLHADYRLRFDVEGMENATPGEWVNKAWEHRHPCIFWDSCNGGFDETSSPLWVRPHKMFSYPLVGYNQIVGHTPMKQVRIDKHLSGFGDYFHMFIDCFEYNGTTHELEI